MVLFRCSIVVYHEINPIILSLRTGSVQGEFANNTYANMSPNEWWYCWPCTIHNKSIYQKYDPNEIRLFANVYVLRCKIIHRVPVIDTMIQLKAGASIEDVILENI